MTNQKVEEFLARETRWREELAELRRIVLDCGLAEELKWGQPCYTDGGRNIVIIHGFKEYCALLFMKGALLKDPAGILIRQTENVQSGRQIRITGVRQVLDLEETLKAYVREAVEMERSGARIEMRKTSDYEVPAEFQDRLDGDPALRAAFESLTPGRQRAYLYFFGQAKQSATRQARVEKCVPRILDGLGLDD